MTSTTTKGRSPNKVSNQTPEETAPLQGVQGGMSTDSFESHNPLLNYFKNHKNVSLVVCFVGIIGFYSYYSYL